MTSSVAAVSPIFVSFEKWSYGIALETERTEWCDRPRAPPAVVENGERCG